MRTPKDFDYDLWTTEDGKNMVRVKATGEVTEVSRQVMLALRSFEMKLKRSQTGIPVEGGKGTNATLMSVDFVSLDSSIGSCEKMTPAWLIDCHDMVDILETEELDKQFRTTLTKKQLSVYMEYILGSQTLEELSDKYHVSRPAIHKTLRQIRQKAKKFFGEG